MYLNLKTKMIFKNYKTIKIILFSTTLLFFFSLNALSHVEHYKKFNYLEYELFRNDKIIGYHKYDFIRANDTLTIKSEVKFKITKLGVDLYQYFANSEENYLKGIFQSYYSKTKQNKKDRYVNINLSDSENSLIIDGSSYKGKANKDFIVGTWWNHEIVKAKAQISGISGRIIDQKVTFLGKEDVKIGNKVYKTLRFNFKSFDSTLPDSKKT